MQMINKLVKNQGLFWPYFKISQLHFLYISVKGTILVFSSKQAIF